MFLEVKFHDNDFSFDIQSTLKTIYGYVKGNLSSSMNDGMTVTDAFKLLNQSEILKKMIIKQTLAYALCHDIEWATRMLYRKEPINPKSVKLLNEEMPRMKNYFDKIELEFHDHGQFTMNWQNSEHVWLDLDTGNVGIF